MIKFTRRDVETKESLETLLRRIVTGLDRLQKDSEESVVSTRSFLLQQIQGLANTQSSLSTSVQNSIQGVQAQLNQLAPADVQVYDEQANQWVDGTAASGTQAGLVTTGAQTFSGDKTFSGSVDIGGTLDVTGAISGDAVSVTNGVSGGTVSATTGVDSDGFVNADGDFTGSATTALYFGPSGTDGSWRIVRSGNDLVIERREAGSWVTKDTIAA